jgi:FkbM family methyltransferase
MSERVHAKFKFNGKNYDFLHPSAQDKTYAVWHSVGEFYEREFLEYVRSLNIQGVYVDVGANIGNHSVWFANECKSTNVISIEMMPEIYDICVENVRNNNHRGVYLEQFNIAALDYSRKVGHSDVLDFCTGGTTVKENAEGPLNGKTLDEVLFNKYPKIDFIKLDIEGCESIALRGAEKIIKRGVSCVAAEALSTKAADELERFARDNNYERINVIGECPAMLIYQKKRS